MKLYDGGGGVCRVVEGGLWWWEADGRSWLQHLTAASSTRLRLVAARRLVPCTKLYLRLLHVLTPNIHFGYDFFLPTMYQPHFVEKYQQSQHYLCANSDTALAAITMSSGTC